MAQQRDTVRLPAWLLNEEELASLYVRLVECTADRPKLSTTDVIARDGLKAIMADRGMKVPVTA